MSHSSTVRRSNAPLEQLRLRDDGSTWYKGLQDGPDRRDDLSPACGIMLAVGLGLVGWAAILSPWLM